LTSLERLQQTAADKGLEVIDYHFKSDRIHGLCCDHTIALSKSLPNSTAKACVLEEEIAHYDLTVGDIIVETIPSNRKQEHKARMLAYTRRAGLEKLTAALRSGHRTATDIAEYMDVTEEFLTDAIEEYRSKYGQYVKVGDDWVILEPMVALLQQIT